MIMLNRLCNLRGFTHWKSSELIKSDDFRKKMKSIFQMSCCQVLTFFFFFLAVLLCFCWQSTEEPQFWVRHLTHTQVQVCPSSLVLLPGGAAPSPAPPVTAAPMASSCLLCLTHKSSQGKTSLILLF